MELSSGLCGHRSSNDVTLRRESVFGTKTVSLQMISSAMCDFHGKDAEQIFAPSSVSDRRANGSARHMELRGERRA